jgi:hypothetical protein
VAIIYNVQLRGVAEGAPLESLIKQSKCFGDKRENDSAVRYYGRDGKKERTAKVGWSYLTQTPSDFNSTDVH